jgi:ketosteroid isomerase-like protein
MMRSLLLVCSLFITLPAFGQNSNSSTTAKPTNANTKQAAPAKPRTDTTKPAATSTVRPAPVAKRTVTTAEPPGSAAVLAAFNRILDGIRKADINAVTGVYWNSPRLVLFNNNGTVTKGWDQMRKNRASSYPDVKDVKLEVRDVSVIMLGRDGALVDCLWTQSQTYKGTPESASGRMSLVFKRMGNDWKAVHLHTSPDKEDASRVLPSEQASPTASPSPSPTPPVR